MNSEELNRQLIKVKETKNADLLESLLYLENKKYFNKQHTEILCLLLNDHWHERHEDIISTLGTIKDPNSLEAIYTASLTIPDWDDGRSLAKKCIWALKDINTTEAIEKIQLLTGSKDPIINEFAKLNL
jgi:hypothetical protein